MKYGVRLHPLSMFPEFDAIVRFVQHAEELGYDFIALPDHTIFPTEYESTMGRDWHDPIILAVALASQTKRIHFATDVLVLPQWQPIRLAKSVATADLATRGRLDIGVGVGWLQTEVDLLGGDFRKRGRMMEEYVAVMKNLWLTHPSTFKGEFISYEDMCCYPKPWQKTGPRILIGGGVHISAERAARIGDGWMPMTTTYDNIVAWMPTLKREMAERKRSMDDFPIYVNVPMFEMSDAVKEHTKRAGGAVDPSFANDIDGARRRFADYNDLGVTHLCMLLSTNYRMLHDQIENIARKALVHF